MTITQSIRAASRTALSVTCGAFAAWLLFLIAASHVSSGGNAEFLWWALLIQPACFVVGGFLTGVLSRLRTHGGVRSAAMALTANPGYWVGIALVTRLNVGVDVVVFGCLFSWLGVWAGFKVRQAGRERRNSSPDSA